VHLRFGHLFLPMRCSVCNKSTETSMRTRNARSGAFFKTENDCGVAEKHLFRVAMGCRCCPNELKPRRCLRILPPGLCVDSMHRHEHGHSVRGLPRARFPLRQRVNYSKSFIFLAVSGNFDELALRAVASAGETKALRRTRALRRVLSSLVPVASPIWCAARDVGPMRSVQNRYAPTGTED